MVVAAATDNSATYGTFVVSIAEQEKLMFNDKRSTPGAVQSSALIINFPLSGVIFVAWISLKTRFWLLS
jgi:hypothetical protein